MSLNLFPFLVLEVLLVMIVAGMIVWRKIVSRNEDDQLHVLHSEGVVMQQANVANKLDLIDKWGKLLTAVAAAVGLALTGLWVYQIWVQGASTATFGS
jgi:hypothetical protein